MARPRGGRRDKGADAGKPTPAPSARPATPPADDAVKTWAASSEDIKGGEESKKFYGRLCRGLATLALLIGIALLVLNWI